MKISLKDVYNPCMSSTVLLQIPVAIYYSFYVTTTMLDKPFLSWKDGAEWERGETGAAIFDDFSIGSGCRLCFLDA